MSYNIEWASPEKTEVWSYQGRLYQSRGKAVIEQNAAKARRDNWPKKFPDREMPSWVRNVQPIYKILWTWEEDNG